MPYIITELLSWKVVKLGLKIVSIAQQTSEIADMLFMKKQQQASKYIFILCKTLTI